MSKFIMWNKTFWQKSSFCCCSNQLFQSNLLDNPADIMLFKQLQVKNYTYSSTENKTDNAKKQNTKKSIIFWLTSENEIKYRFFVLRYFKCYTFPISYWYSHWEFEQIWQTSVFKLDKNMKSRSWTHKTHLKQQNMAVLKKKAHP